jgi:hypothetical protein
MRATDIPEFGWVRLADSPRFGVHAGQTMMVVGREGRRYVVECEDEHHLTVTAADLRPRLVDQVATYERQGWTAEAFSDEDDQAVLHRGAERKVVRAAR